MTHIAGAPTNECEDAEVDQYHANVRENAGKRGTGEPYRSLPGVGRRRGRQDPALRPAVQLRHDLLQVASHRG